MTKESSDADHDDVAAPPHQVADLEELTVLTHADQRADPDRLPDSGTVKGDVAALQHLFGITADDIAFADALLERDNPDR